MGGLEILLVSAVIAGLLGIRFRHEKMQKLVAFILGFVGAGVVAFVLTFFVFGSYLIIPVYAIFGSWLIHYVLKRSRND